MAAPFIFGKIAEGNNFIDRENDTKRLGYPVVEWKISWI